MPKTSCRGPSASRFIRLSLTRPCQSFLALVLLLDGLAACVMIDHRAASMTPSPAWVMLSHFCWLVYCGELLLYICLEGWDPGIGLKHGFQPKALTKATFFRAWITLSVLPSSLEITLSSISSPSSVVTSFLHLGGFSILRDHLFLFAVVISGLVELVLSAALPHVAWHREETGCRTGVLKILPTLV